MRSTTTRSAREEIIRSALRLYGKSGIETTSLRQVARSAGVSPALVVHHFGSKEGLVAAVDEAALREFGDAYAADQPEEGVDLLRERAGQTARVMAERPDVCAYLGRALVEGTAGSVALFKSMIEGGRAEIDSLAEAGALRAEADPLWATLQHFFLIWAPLSFMPLIEETMGRALLDLEQLDRWVDANVELLREGLYE